MITPKEKAQELVNKYLDEIEIGLILAKISESLAKQYALIAVNELIKDNNKLEGNIFQVMFWEEVKKEIEKL
jgi:hypothetical protein